MKTCATCGINFDGVNCHPSTGKPFSPATCYERICQHTNSSDCLHRTKPPGNGIGYDSQRITADKWADVAGKISRGDRC